MADSAENRSWGYWAQTRQSLSGGLLSSGGQTGKLMISIQWTESHGGGKKVGLEYRGGKDLGKLLNVSVIDMWFVRSFQYMLKEYRAGTSRTLLWCERSATTLKSGWPMLCAKGKMELSRNKKEGGHSKQRIKHTWRQGAMKQQREEMIFLGDGGRCERNNTFGGMVKDERRFKLQKSFLLN